MSNPSEKSIRKAERRAARRAELNRAAAKRSMLMKADSFLAGHAPSKTDLAWYSMLRRVAGIGAAVALMAAVAGSM